MTPSQFLQEKNIVTEYVEGFTDRNGFIHISVEQLLTEYAESLQLIQSCVVDSEAEYCVRCGELKKINGVSGYCDDCRPKNR